MNPPKAARIRRLTTGAAAVFTAAIVLSPISAYAAAPSNDAFAGRTPITTLPFTDAQDTTDATVELDEPQPDCTGRVGATLWYEYTADRDTVLEADTLGSDFDTFLTIWTGDGPGSLAQVGCSDDASGLQSIEAFSVSAGTTYLIQVGGWEGEFGALSFRLGPPTTGSISGTVTSSTGQPLPNLCIDLRSAGGGWGGPGGWARTNSTGGYTIGGLPDGTYHLRFYDGCDRQRDHAAEWFDDQPTQETATPVVVTSPEALMGVDAELTALPLGFISGTVTSSKGGPLEDVCVEVYSAAGEYFGSTMTSSTGSYTYGAPDGTYNVFFFDACGNGPRDHEDEWFDDQPRRWTATDVVVTSPETIEGIDAELAALGSISGTVTADTGEPLEYSCVRVHDAATGDWAGWAETASSGSYTAHVPPGTFHVEFYDCQGVRNYGTEWFDDQPTRETATPVVVNGPNNTPGIDAELTTLYLGSISGTVTSDAGDPLGNICVGVYESAAGYFIGWAETTSSGSYAVEIPDGTYYIEFFDCYGNPTIDGEWYDDQPSRSTAHAVVVAAGEDVAGIDAALAVHRPDPPAPETTITSGPPGITTSTTAGFTFASSVTGSSFECSLDGSNFSTCTSPAAYTGLSDGSHTFRVRAVGPDGEVDASPAHRSWVVDRSAPDLTILRPTGGPYVNDQSAGGTGPIVVVGFVRVEVTAVDPHSGVPTFGFEVDGIPLDPDAMTRQGNTYSFRYIPVTPGEHTIGLRATNGAGLQSAMTIDVIGVPAG
jgi:Carboxypeptidase regulatory-like domain